MSVEKDKQNKPYKLYTWGNNLYIIKDDIYQYFKAANTTEWIPYPRKLSYSGLDLVQPPEYIKDLTEEELFLELL